MPSQQLQLIAQDPVPNFIGGKTVTSESTYDVVESHEGTHLHNVCGASEANVDAAVDAASAAFDSWSNTPIVKRAEIFREAARVFEENKAELGQLYARECSVSDAWAGFNISLTIAGLLETAGVATQLRGEIVPAAEPGKQIYLERVPFGVVFGIAPWNAAYILGYRAVRDAIMAGNTVVLKTSEYSPRVHLSIADVFKAAGLPDGVLNIVHMKPEDAPRLCERIIARREVGKVNFTGSTFVGAKIGEVCGRYIKPCVLELGGKAPLIVLPSADIELAASGAAFGGFHNSGQICMSTDVLLVHESVADDFKKRLAARVNKISAGSSGAIKGLFAEKSAKRLQGLVEDAQSKGATVLAGKLDIKRTTMQPLVLADVNDSMRVAEEESFGPLLTVRTFKTEDEAVKIANQSEYGLSSSVYGAVPDALRIARRIVSGAVHINSMTVSDSGYLAHGGMKASGFGRFNHLAGLHEFTTTKVISVSEPQAYPF